jgi:hypothetical protein
MAQAKATTWLVRLDVAARTVAAVGGGYVLTAIITGLGARHLPLAPAQAVLVATVLSFAVYAVVIVWAFSAKSTLKVWLWLGGACAALGALLWLSIDAGGRL